MVRKAVVMAGGLATRLRPLTTSINKHMLPVYDRPMIQRVIEHLVRSGITDILILLNHSFAQPVMELLEHGDQFGCSITYGYERQAATTGIGKHLAYARSFVGNEPFMVMLGDSYYTKPFNLVGLKRPHLWAMPLDPKFDDFRKYAEIELSSDGTRVINITEKPAIQKTGIIQTGAWVFNPDVFDLSDRFLRECPGEVQMRTIVAHYLRTNTLWVTMLPAQSFLDLGTPDALLLAGTMAKQESCARTQT